MVVITKSEFTAKSIADVHSRPIPEKGSYIGEFAKTVDGYKTKARNDRLRSNENGHRRVQRSNAFCTSRKRSPLLSSIEEGEEPLHKPAERNFIMKKPLTRSPATCGKRPRRSMLSQMIICRLPPIAEVE